LGIEGDLAIGGRYVAEIDLASGDVVVRDLFVAVGDAQESGEYLAGHYLEPFSLELDTSSNSFAFLERSPVNVLDPERNWGVGLLHVGSDDFGTLALGVFRDGIDANDFEGGEGSNIGVTGKLTVAPVNEGNGERLLHLGLALSERVPENGVIVVSQRPQSSLLDLGDGGNSPFVPRIRVPADFQQLLNLQFALARGAFWTQAEWYGSWIDQQGGGTVFFHGFHADCGVFLTGEHREYVSQSGVFGAVKVKRPLIRWFGGCHRPPGWGAWELAARISYLDFQDPDTPRGAGGALVGIRMPQSTLGVNWYLADRIRLMFNYTCAEPDEPNTRSSVAHLFATRLNVFW
jgi:phosphate-selective porin OprO/OprP